jgi:tol-pal system protein YbgF
MCVDRFHFGRMGSNRPTVLIPLLSLLFAGCVSTADFDAMKSDLNQVKRENQELKKSLSDTRKVKEDSFYAMRESQSSLLSQVNELSTDLRVLRGRFDENKFNVDKSLKEGAMERDLLRAQIGSLENRVKELQGKTAAGAETGVAGSRTEEGLEKGKEAEQPKEVSPKKEKAKTYGEGVEDDPVRAYESAYNLFEEKKYKEARDSFASYIKRFPKSSLSGNAQFWIAECYFAEKDYESAILDYEKLIKMYPGNQKIPGALYKQGLSFLELKDMKTAKVIFQRLIESYPDSKLAEMAKKKVAEINKKVPPSKKGK